MMLIFITGFAGIFCSYFSQKRSQKLHSIVGAMGFAVAGPAWICLGLSLFKDFGTMAWAIVLIGIAVTGSVFFGFVRTKSLPAIYEMVFFLGILISDLIVFWMI